MGNHYHLILETPRANLNSFMHALGSGYTTYFNIKRKRSGHLFQGRYKAILIDKDSCLLELSRYVHLNPVRAKLVERAEHYPYSSYRAYIFPEQKSMVARNLIWGMIDPLRYREFVESGVGKDLPDPPVYGGMMIGKKQFIKETLRRITEGTFKNREISHRRRLGSHNVEDIVRLLSSHFKVSEETVRTSSPYRTYAIYLTRKHTDLTNREIGDYFGGISYSAVTKTGTRLMAKMAGDKALQKELGRVEALMSRVKG